MKKKSFWEKLHRRWVRSFGHPQTILCEMDHERYWRERSKTPGSLRPRDQVFLRWLERKEACPKVLDLGCGDGRFAQFIQERLGSDVLCVDISQKAVELAKAKGLQARVLDVEKDVILGEYDVAVLSELVEHLAQPEKLLLRLKKHTRYVFISIPNIAYIEHRIRLLFGKFPVQWAYYPGEHLRFWSISDFIHTARSLGLEIEEVKASDGIKVLKDILPNLFGENICIRLRVK